MSKNPCKVNVSDEHRHMIRLYMVHHRLSSMQEATARMIETVMEAEGEYTYRPPQKLSNNGNNERKGGIGPRGAQSPKPGEARAAAATAKGRISAVTGGGQGNGRRRRD